MSDSLLLPKFSPPTRLYLVKVCAAASLLLMLTLVSVCPVQAQGYGGWSAEPCDAQGTPFNAYPDNQGFYTLSGNEKVDVDNKYSPDLIAAVLNGTYTNFQACSPLASIDYGPIPGVVLYKGISGWADAFNNEMNGSGYFNSQFTYDVSSSSGLLNGSIKTSLTGQLFYYFKVMWQGRGAPTVAMPDHIDLLLKTTVTATADVSYGLSGQDSGLKAMATASDGSPFNEMASAYAGDAVGGGSSVPTVVGYHLVRASVDPGTGIAEVYLNGTGEALALNKVPYGTDSATSSIEDKPTNGSATADATCGVAAVVKQDNRDVTISSSLGQTSHKSTTNFDSNGVALPDPDTPDSNGTTNANSVKPDSSVDELITYYASPAGSWAANSSYLWNIVEGTSYLSSSSGTFTLPGDPPDTYAALYSLACTTAGREHVYIHLTDAGDGADATNNYYIAWHDSGENWQVKGNRVEVAPKLFGTSDNAQPANGFDNVKIAPDEVDWSVGEHIGGGILTVGGAALAVAQPETSPFVIGFLTAAGYKLSLATPPDPTLYTPQGTEAQFTADVNTENQITNGDTAGVFMPSAERILPALAQQIAISGNYHDYFTGATGSGFHFGMQVYRHRFAQNRVGDGYGAQGYYGQESGVLTNSGSLEYVYNWK